MAHVSGALMLKKRINSHVIQLATRLSVLHATFPQNMTAAERSINKNLKLKAVVFDLAGVFTPSPVNLIRDVERHYHLEPLKLGKRIEACPEFRDLQKGKLDLESFAVATKSFFKDLIPPEELRDAIFRIFGAVSFEHDHFQIVYEAVKCLRADGMRTALLTNNWLISRNFLEHPLPVSRKLFDTVLESHRIGICKPDPEIYLLALRQLGIQAHEALFVDDLGRNLKPARKLGLHTLKAETPRQVVSDLEQILNLTLRGFAPETVSPAPHFCFPVDKLKSYLDTVVEKSDQLPSVRQFLVHGARLNPTYFVVHGGRKLVLRRKHCFPIEQEYKLYVALSDSNVPVPKVIAYCSDLSVIGSEFFLMDYVDGAVYRDPTLHYLQSEKRRKIFAEMNRVLSAIHSVDKSAFKLDKIIRPHQSGLSLSTEKPSTLLKSVRIGESNESSKLLHGDFRLENLIFDPRNDRLLCVLDWKNASLGDPYLDVLNSSYYLATKGLEFSFVTDHVNEYCKMADVPPDAALKLISSLDEAVKKSARTSSFAVSPDDLSPKAKQIYVKLAEFIETKVGLFERQLCSNSRFVEELKSQAKSDGLWNLFLNRDLAMVECVHMAEMLGRYFPLGPTLFNCSEPDASNIEVLIHCGSEAQKIKWLPGLLSGEIRSALVIDQRASMKQNGEELTLNGHGLWGWGVLDPQCQLLIVQNLSLNTQILVPKSAKGVKVTTGPQHAAVDFNNVRLDVSEALLEMGEFNEIHLLRYVYLIGMAARALDKALANSRGGPVRLELARCYAELEQVRLLALKTAYLLDHKKQKVKASSSSECSLEMEIVKALVPELTQRIVATVQLHGLTNSREMPQLPSFSAAIRSIQLANGRGEVHWQQVAKMLSEKN